MPAPTRHQAYAEESRRALADGLDLDDVALFLGIRRDSLLLTLRRNAYDELAARLLASVRRQPAPVVHGANRYRSQGCRCDVCRIAHSTAHRERRRDRQTPPAHGVSGYQNWGCRCDICLTAGRAHLRAQKAQAGPGKNRGQAWTVQDLAIVSERPPGSYRYARTALECATLLGRSVAAVQTQRYWLRHPQQVAS